MQFTVLALAALTALVAAKPLPGCPTGQVQNCCELGALGAAVDCTPVAKPRKTQKALINYCSKRSLNAFCCTTTVGGVVGTCTAA